MLPVIGEMVMPSAVLTPEELAAKATVVPEDIGIDVPYSPEIRDEIDRELGIPQYQGGSPKELTVHV